jgi:uncharacterized protein (UPF0210 family)
MRLTAEENLKRARQMLKEDPEVMSSFQLRTVTMGLNLFDTISADMPSMTKAVENRLNVELPAFQEAVTGAIGDVFDGLTNGAGLPALQTRRVTVTPLEILTRAAVASGKAKSKEIVKFAQAIEKTVRDHVGQPSPGQNVFLGGAGFLADRGISNDRQAYIKALPDVLAGTKIFNANITVGSTRGGIFLDSVQAAADIIWQVGSSDNKFTEKLVPNPLDESTWKLSTKDREAFGKGREIIRSKWGKEAKAAPFFSNLARLAVFVNAPPENPFMAGGFAGLETPARTISVGINGAGVIAAAIRAVKSNSLNDIIESVKDYSAKMYIIAEAIRFHVIAKMREAGFSVGEADGVVDLSVAATNDRAKDGTPTNSIASAMEALGVRAGAHGSVAATGLIIDNLKKAGSGAISYAGGLSGTFIPISEDAGMADAVKLGSLTFARYLSLTAVCSVGIDMFIAHWPKTLIQEDFKAHIGGMLLDEMAIGVYTNKTTSARIIPVQWKPKDDLWVVLMGGAGLLGNAPVMDLQFDTLPAPKKLLKLSGAFPAPITSFRN